LLRSEPLTKAEYDRLVERIRAFVPSAIPVDATVLVVSRGDEMLVQLEGRRAWHFPRAEDGRYAGHHPADSAEAIAHLEDLHRRGAQYVLFPKTAAWWLEHYEELRHHFDANYRCITFDADLCTIYELEREAQKVESAGEISPSCSARQARLSEALSDFVTNLLPLSATVVLVSEPDFAFASDGFHVRTIPRRSQVTSKPPMDQDQIVLREIERHRERGARFLVLPRPQAPWLEHNGRLEREVESRYRRLAHQTYLGNVFDLSEAGVVGRTRGSGSGR
jgi:hypothetical protein